MKTYLYTLILLISCAFCTNLYSQLDSVYYKGPSQGSVTAGAIQTTDIFPDHSSGGEDDTKEIIQNSASQTGRQNLIFGWKASQLPEYRFVEDSPASGNLSGNSGQTVLLNKFPAISMTNFIPPDPAIAAGPEHIIVCANSTFKIMDKNGNVLKSISAAVWWAPAWPDENGDPQVIYDHYSNRWVLVWMQVNSSAQTAGNLIAYSDDNNPLGTWYMYRLDTKMHGTISSNTWGDYPKIGYDEEAIYIMTRCISFSGGGIYNKIRIINKAELYSSNAGPLTYNDIWDIRIPGQGSAGQVLDCITPGISYTPGNGGWFFWASGVYAGNPVSADFYALYKIINPLTNPVLRGKVLPVQLYTSPPLANQLGGGTGIETIGWITKGPVIRDGSLYVAHDIQNSINASYSSIKYLKVDLTTHTIVDNIEFGSEGYFYLFPALTVDKDHNAAITFSRSADNEYIGAYYSTKYANDAVLSPSLPYAVGNGNYVVTYNTGINRWGDYFGIYLDPVNEYDVWMMSEYAASTNIWGTYVGHIRMTTYPGAHAFLSKNNIDFGDVEIGTSSTAISTILANYGENDLVISNIPSSFEDYNLITNISFPVTLSSYDSLTLEFTYSPNTIGTSNVLFPINNNDPDFDGITLSGNCYRIIPANEKTIYASSGSQNDGKIVIVDPITGSASIVGQSLFPEIKGLAINPINGIIYGAVSISGASKIVRVNSELGDSYFLFDVNIPSLADIAFDSSGTLYGIGVNGETYTINLSDGETTFLVDAIGSYSGITFHPQTNEMWATSRAFVGPNKDAVFRVNLSSGDTTIVGHTGLNKLTNDLVFDEELNLFGVVGSASELNDLININTSNGAGTIIGSIGMKNILGLAYIESSPSGVDDDVNNDMPNEYVLLQNYPNPFNPSTVISYRLPFQSFVTVKVYDILGTEISTLVNEEQQPGNYEVEFNLSRINKHTSGTFISSGYSSGVYFYQLKAGNNIQTKKMVMIK